MEKEQVIEKIEVELKKRNTPIRNKNAIEKFLGLFPILNGLYGVLNGSSDAIEVERQKLTLSKILDLVVALDEKLSGKDISNTEPGLKILISKAIAEGNITGLQGRTSSDTIQKIFEKPVDISIKDSYAKGNITGIKLDVDKEMPIKGKTKI